MNMLFSCLFKLAMVLSSWFSLFLFALEFLCKVGNKFGDFVQKLVENVIFN